MTLTDTFNCLVIEVFKEDFNINKNVIIVGNILSSWNTVKIH